MASNSPLRVGFVGLSSAGWASRALAPAIFQEALKDKIDLVAVSTRSQGSADASAEVYSEKLGHPVKAYSGSTSAVANDPDVNFVAVSIAAMQHKNAVLPVIEAGKAFFVEWPAGSSSRDTAAIAEAARLHNVRSLVGLQARASRAITKVREVLQSGKIGRVLSVQARLFAGREGLIRQPPGKVDPSRNNVGGRETGSLWQPFVKVNSPGYYKKDAGVNSKSITLGHFLDTFTFILGELKTVVAAATIQYPTITFVDDDGVPTGETMPSEVYDHFSLIGELESGASYNISMRACEKTVPGRKNFEWIIDGEEGTVVLSSDVPLGSYINIFDPDVFVNGEKVDLGGPGGAPYNITETWKNFVDGKEGYPSIEDAVRNHARLDAIEKSIVEGRAVQLSAIRGQFN